MTAHYLLPSALAWALMIAMLTRMPRNWRGDTPYPLQCSWLAKAQGALGMDR